MFRCPRKRGNFTTTSSALFATYAYDPLQRVSQVTTAVGSTTNAYKNWTVTTTDPDGHVKDYTKDAYGNLASVVEHVGGAYASTTYAWDLNGDLTNITDALGNVRNFTYDGLGRRLTAQDLHAPGDATFGSWSYVFDPAGNLTQQTDPKSQVVNYTYDTLNRLLTEDFTGQAGTELTNTYDTCLNGKLHLCSASSTGAIIQYGYNPLGLASVSTSTIVGTTTAFATQYAYDREGNNTAITYPDNAQVQYLYDASGQIGSVQEKENGGAFSSIVTSFGYSPVGQVASIGYGNGVSTINTYDPNALYRLSKKVTLLPNAQHAQDLSYAYDPVGNITSIVDNSATAAAKTTYYTYDNLSRLLTASTTNATTTPDYKYTYAYDALGNITSGPLGAYAYTGNTGSNYADPDAPTAVGSTTLSYDQNGNLTSEGPTSYTWDYRNRSILSGNGSATSSYAYDDQDNRVKLVEGTATTFFPNTLYSAASGGLATTTKNIFADGFLVSTIEKANSGAATPTYVQSKLSTTTQSVTLPNAVTSGDLIIVGITVNTTSNIASNAVTDNKGNTYTKLIDISNGGRDHVTIFYAANVSGGASFTASSSIPNVTSESIGVYDYAGIATCGAFDQAASSTGSSASPNSGNATTTAANELYFGLAWNRASGTWAAGSGYTLRQTATSSGVESFASEDRVINTATTTAATFTSPNNIWDAALATFKPANAPPSSPTVRYISTDQLSGADVVTNASGTVAETLDYYPYGGLRIDAKTNYGGVRNKYAGTVYDALSGLNYVQARYQDPQRGQFLSEDPVFLGNPKDQNLRDPQSLAVYAYASGNPIIKSDATGKDAQSQVDFAIQAQTQAAINQQYSTMQQALEKLMYTVANTGIMAQMPEEESLISPHISRHGRDQDSHDIKGEARRDRSLYQALWGPDQAGSRRPGACERLHQDFRGVRRHRGHAEVRGRLPAIQAWRNDDHMQGSTR